MILLHHDVLPVGWKQGSLLDIADYLNGLAMQKFRPTDNEDGIPVLKIKELRQGMCDSSSELCSPNINAEYIVSDGDVIFSWSGSLLVDFWCVVVLVDSINIYLKLLRLNMISGFITLGRRNTI